MNVESEQWPGELTDYYHSLSLSDSARESVVQMNAAALETRRWKRIAGALAAACIALAAMSTFFMVSRNAETGMVDGTIETPRTVNQTPGTIDEPVAANYDLVAVRVHRDWCGRSKSMGNVFAELQDDLSGRRILFLTFDLTDSETTRQSLVVSDRLAISKPLQGIESGNIVLLDRNGQRLETLDGTAGREYLATQIASRL